MSLYKKLGFLCFFFSFLIVATKVKLVIVLILESFSAVSLLPPKIFSVFFFFASFLSSLGVLVSISKGQVSTRTIKSLRLESTHKSGKLICMSKIVCSQADIQSK